jgi:hypothetical protein
MTIPSPSPRTIEEAGKRLNKTVDKGLMSCCYDWQDCWVRARVPEFDEVTGLLIKGGDVRYLIRKTGGIAATQVDVIRATLARAFRDDEDFFFLEEYMEDEY